MESLISVIVTTRNSARTLEHCLQSIKNQSYKNIELIVVDRDSTDATKEIVQKYTDQIFNFGPERSAQRNFGARQARGEYLFIPDSDIYLDVDSVKECVALIEKEKCDAIILPEKSIGIGFWAKVKAFERSFYVGNDYMEGARFFAKDKYLLIGGYDENLYAGEDWDLTIRFRENGCRISRASILIEHDEGQINLFGSSHKKRYYSANFFEIYAKKHPEEFRKQMSFFVRFPFNKIITHGLRHPILFSGTIFMKGLEYYNSLPKNNKIIYDRNC